MRRISFIVVLLIFYFVGLSIGEITPSARSYFEGNGEIIIKIADGGSIATIMQKYALAQIDQIKSENRFLLKAQSGSDIVQLVESIRREPGVQQVEPNSTITTPFSALRQPHNFPGDEATVVGNDIIVYRSQQLTTFLQLKELQTLSTGERMEVAVIDTGVDTNHPALAKQIAAGGYDFLDNDAAPQEVAGGSSYGHGTFIAGLILLAAPKARILPIRVMDTNGNGTAFNVAKAIRYAADRHVKVINLSLGTDENPDVVVEALKYAVNSNCLLVAAMGNSDSGNSEIFPANDPLVLGVAATDFYDLKASFSNYGTVTDLCAPGVDLVSTYPGGLYARWSGTSFAAPLVAAEGALLFAALPFNKRDDAEVLKVMLKADTVIDIEKLQLQYTGMLGEGRILPLAAVKQAISQ